MTEHQKIHNEVIEKKRLWLAMNAAPEATETIEQNYQNEFMDEYQPLFDEAKEWLETLPARDQNRITAALEKEAWDQVFEFHPDAVEDSIEELLETLEDEIEAEVEARMEAAA